MRPFENILGSAGPFRLADISVALLEGRARFSARLIGPAGKNVWARAWIANEAGTLAEAASPQSRAGEIVTLDVPLPESTAGCSAYMRIESAPLQTEHVVASKFDDKG